MKNGFILVVWLFAGTGAVVATLVLMSGFATATGAPQEAVIAALACAIAILPYCFARAVTEILRLPGPEQKETPIPEDPITKDYNHKTLGL